MSNADILHGTTTDSLEIIEFYIDEVTDDGEEYRSYYGMNVAKVLEIIRMPTITEVPGKRHDAALGTFNLRDRVLPLVDLGLWLNKKTTHTENQKVIVSEFGGIVTAFVVTGVTRIHRITWAQVEPPGKYLQAFSHDSVTGVMRIEERILFLLDMEYVISTMNPSLNLANHTIMGEGSGMGRGCHVLVVDDSISVRNTISYCLEHEEFTVTKATCGSEAWNLLQDWLKEAGEKAEPISKYVSLVISDIEMPEMDGHTLTAKIKHDPVLKKIPVILFSSIITDVVREKGVKAGADDQVSKPGLSELPQKARQIIDTYRSV